MRYDETFHLFITLGLTREKNCITMYIHGAVLVLMCVSFVEGSAEGARTYRVHCDTISIFY